MVAGNRVQRQPQRRQQLLRLLIGLVRRRVGEVAAQQQRMRLRSKCGHPLHGVLQAFSRPGLFCTRVQMQIAELNEQRRRARFGSVEDQTRHIGAMIEHHNDPRPAVQSPSPILSASQLATLALHGEERTAAVGDVLFRVGDRRYPFIAILEGEAAILDADGHEIIRHGASGFLGEMNLLSGQTVYLTAVVTAADALHRGRSRAAAPAAVRGRAARAICCCRRSSRAARRCSSEGVGLRGRRPALVGADAADGRLRAAQPAALHLARPGALRRSGGGGADRRARRRRAAAGAAAGRARAAQPVAAARCRARWGSGSSSPRARRSTCVVDRRRPGRAGRGGVRGLGGIGHARRGGHRARAARRARRGGSRTTLAFRPGSAARSSPPAPSPRRGSSTPAPRPHTARSRSSRATSATSCASRMTTRSRRARSCWPRAPIPPPARRGPRGLRGLSVFYAAGPPEAQRCGATRVGVDRGRQLGRPGRDLARPRRRARHAAAPPRRPARDDVRLPHRTSSSATASRFATAARSPSCTAPTASSKRSRCATGSGSPFSFLFLFLGARPAPTGSATSSPATSTGLC